MANATETGYGTDSEPELGVLVPACYLNREHVMRWVDGGDVIEQNARIVSVDRPDLFPAGPLWRRIDIGGCVLFLGRPAV